MNEQVKENILDEDILTSEELTAMTAEEKLVRINAYRAHINQGENYLLSENACRNSVFLLRAVRMSNVASNPRAKKAAKPAAPVLDLSSL